MCALIHFIFPPVFSQFNVQGGNSKWSVIASTFESLFSNIHLGEPAVQRNIWIFVLTLVLPWIFLFIDFGLPRNRQQDQLDHNVQQHDYDDGFAERIPQALEPEIEQGPDPYFGAEDHE
jgi:hypothetical protein